MDNNITALEQLKGKTFKLGQFEPNNYREFTVTDVKCKATNTILFTNKRTFNFIKSEITPFLEAIEIVETKQPFKPNLNSVEPIEDLVIQAKEKIKNEKNSTKVNLSVFELTETQVKTQNALTNMLDKVLAGEKDAIPKAKAVCDIANTMVNMEKTQIQLMNIALKQTRR